MEEFIQNIKILTNTLGHKVFEEKREIKPSHLQAKETFFIKAVRGADAQGQPTSDGFVVYKGSKISSSTVPSMSSNFIKLREQLLDSGAIVNNNEILQFPEDFVFTSPSTAAAIVLGRNANGLTEWKQKDGTTLKDFESNKK
jgi:hypothetical protein